MSEPKYTTGPLVVGVYMPSAEFLQIPEHVAVMKPTGELIAITGKAQGKNEERSKADAELYCIAAEMLDGIDVLERECDFSRLVYDVRDREMQGWMGPRVTAVNAATMKLTAALKKLGRR